MRCRRSEETPCIQSISLDTHLPYTMATKELSEGNRPLRVEKLGETMEYYRYERKE